MILYQTLKKERLKGRKHTLGMKQVLARNMLRRIEREDKRMTQAIERLTRPLVSPGEIRAVMDGWRESP